MRPRGDPEALVRPISEDAPRISNRFQIRSRSGRPSLLQSTPGRLVGLAASLVLLVAVCAASLAIGARPIPLHTVFNALFAFDPKDYDHLVVATLRVPRTEVGLLVGICLGLSGALLQGITRNPLADSGVLGLNSGSALAVVVGIHWLGIATLGGYVWLGFLGAAAGGGLVFVLGASSRGGATPLRLALAGAAVAAFAASLTSAVLLADVVTFDQFRYWAVGSLLGRNMGIAWQILPFVAIAAIAAAAASRGLDAIAFGDDIARSLGVRVGATRLTAFVAAVLLVGSATAVAGPIAFVGLVVPYLARAIAGASYRWVLPYSAMLGSSLLLIADVIGRVIAPPAELEVGIITAVLGAPFFIAVARRRNLANL